ncbi:hypothetical protein L1049_001173 [Liquidambar formosana]|uniref:RING-type E3 ubiquitin transferase n=1 Tax=Liquidambar formosana TaxID=63359 RepID=A0AAP0R5C3_LIQFO
MSSNMSYDSDESLKFEESVVFPCTKSLSKMSGDQASGLKELERDYEEVLDENCREFVGYLKSVLGNKDGSLLMKLPSLILRRVGKGDELEGSADEKITEEEFGSKNRRYNPIWAEGDRSAEFYSSSGSGKIKSPPFYPERVSANILKTQKSSGRLRRSPKLNSDSELESSSGDNSTDSSFSDSEAETKEKNRQMALFDSRKSQSRKQKQSISAESSRSPDRLMADSDSLPGGGKYTPPKDFVCPITSHLFDDPVTLETGQTYERKAIQEWLDRGNSTCPITRQKLQSTQLPKTNYVLKRLIASWQEQNPGSVPIQSETPHPKTEPVSNSIMPSTSPNSVISQATIDGTFSELRHAITNLCMSEILKESEMAVLRIERFWQEASMEAEIQTMLSKPPVINGFVEILFNSVDPRVLKATVFLLSELGSRDKSVIQTLTQVDSDVECVVALFKKGLQEAVVLIYLLKPSSTSLIEMDMVESLLTVIKKNQEDMLEICLKPKTASVLLLRQILGSGEESSVSSIAKTLIGTKVIENIIGSLQAEWAEERIAAVAILLRCIQEDGKCRNNIADKAELAPVLESFMGASDTDRFEIVQFLSELVKLNRRTFNEQVLHIIKDEGAFSTMHTLLIFLQTALQDQCPVVAGLLLQLDLLTEPRKMSIYREEAIDTLISCLRNSDFPAAQIAAAETIVSLQGRFTSSGKSLTREGLKSRYAELCSACFVSATWLVHMLTVLPDTGIRGAARVCLLKHFISIFKSAKDTEDKALSMLALSSFTHDPEGLHDLTLHMKDILKGLRELKKSSPLAYELLKIFSEGQESSAVSFFTFGCLNPIKGIMLMQFSVLVWQHDLWNHKELVQVDCTMNGEVLSIVCFKDKIFSGHSDGTIKVWTGRGSILHLVQETREHTKAVTSLAILQSGEKLYSGSLDRTTRVCSYNSSNLYLCNIHTENLSMIKQVWSIGSEGIHCVQLNDMKDQVHNLVVANSISCIIPQGAGVKVHSWNGGSKLLNPNKNVRSLALVQGKLYCGCNDNSIQEVDLATGTLGNIQSGSRKLLGKANPVHALQVYDGLIYSASSSLDGAAVKIWNASSYNMVGSLPSTQEIRAMVVGSELIYLGCKGGAVEIWCRKKLNRVESLQAGTTGKVLCMALDDDEEFLVIGTSDGRIQAWELS